MTLPSTAGDTPAPGQVFRKGLGLKKAVAGSLDRDYRSAVVDAIRQDGGQYTRGRLTVHLPQEFGFCYGVDRAIDYAYQSRERFPHRNVYVTSEIIHNPQVNSKLRDAGVHFLSDAGVSMDDVTASDVVILPAFGVPVRDLVELQNRGCTIVDTTCGSVLNVWKNVRRYTRDGFTAVIHGKVQHEETQATASQALNGDGGRYLVVLDRDEAELTCGVIRGEVPADRFMARLDGACNPGFDPAVDLERVGLANQTTMLMSESLAIGEMFRAAMVDRYGIADLDCHYRAFDTICSATQERQDAILELLDGRAFDLTLVIGGYNSSNTKNLARICTQAAPTYHIADPSCLVSVKEIRHRCGNGTASESTDGEATTRNWLPASGTVTVAVTSGASTPDSTVGEVIERLSTLLDP